MCDVCLKCQEEEIAKLERRLEEIKANPKSPQDAQQRCGHCKLGSEILQLSEFLTVKRSPATHFRN